MCKLHMEHRQKTGREAKGVNVRANPAAWIKRNEKSVVGKEKVDQENTVSDLKTWVCALCVHSGP